MSTLSKHREEYRDRTVKCQRDRTVRGAFPVCGKLGHKTSKSGECPARGKTCSHCQKPHHFKNCCWEKHPGKKPKFKPRPKSMKAISWACVGSKKSENSDLRFKPTLKIGRQGGSTRNDSRLSKRRFHCQLGAVQEEFPHVEKSRREPPELRTK